MRTILALMFICVSAFAQTQDGNSVTLGEMTADKPATILGFNDGSTDCDGGPCLIYTCTAYSDQPSFPFSINQATLTNIVDATNTATVTTAIAHGLAVNNRVFISGASDPDLNGYYRIATVGSSTTFTITTANVTDATYTDAALKVETKAPRTTVAIWKVMKLTYTTGQFTAKQNSAPPTGQICDNRATLTYN